MDAARRAVDLLDRDEAAALRTVLVTRREDSDLRPVLQPF
jgi:hypothetical protein